MTCRILVVDDEPDMVELLRLILRRGGWEILTATSGTEALQVADHYVPELILLDIMMPDLSGHEVCVRLRADARFRHIPILAFTAQCQLEEQRLALQSGADDFIVKPIAPRDLVQRVQSFLVPAPAPA